MRRQALARLGGGGGPLAGAVLRGVARSRPGRCRPPSSLWGALPALGYAARPAGPRLRLRAAAEWPPMRQLGPRLRGPSGGGVWLGVRPPQPWPSASAPLGQPVGRGVASVVLESVVCPACSPGFGPIGARRPRLSGGASPPSCPSGPGPLLAACVRSAGSRPPLPLWAVACVGLRPAAKRHGGYRVPPCAAVPLPSPCAARARPGLRPLVPPLRGGRLWPRTAGPLWSVRRPPRRSCGLWCRAPVGVCLWWADDDIGADRLRQGLRK